MQFTNKSKQRRPKFLLFLQINELVNIPQSSGYCYVKWNIKEGTGTTKNPLRSNTESYIHTSTQSKGVTPHVLVKHHRAEWNYSLEHPVELKLHLDRNRDIVSKCLSLEVYFEFLSDASTGHGGLRRNSRSNSDSSRRSRGSIGSLTNNLPRKLTPLTQDNSSTTSSTTTTAPSTTATAASIASVPHNGTPLSPSSATPKVSGKMFLGSVLINIAEYISEDESPITNRFLLRDSKINSILNVTIQLKLIRGHYTDFHINSHTLKSRPSNTFKNGISNILNGDKNQELISPVSSTFNRPTRTPMQLDLRVSSDASGATHNGVKMDTTRTPSFSMNSTTQDSYGSINSSNSNVPRGITSTLPSQMNSLVDSLYAKTFQLSWDPIPNEFSPAECVEDILRGGDGWAKNENGINMIDLQVLKLNELEAEYYATGLNGNDSVFARYANEDSRGSWQAKDEEGEDGEDVDIGVDADVDEEKERKKEKEREEEERNWERMDRREFMDKRQQLATKRHPSVASQQNQQSYQDGNGQPSGSGSAVLLGESEGSGRRTGVDGSDSSVVLGYTKSWSVRHITT